MNLPKPLRTLLAITRLFLSSRKEWLPAVIIATMGCVLLVGMSIIVDRRMELRAMMAQAEAAEVASRKPVVHRLDGVRVVIEGQGVAADTLARALKESGAIIEEGPRTGNAFLMKLKLEGKPDAKRNYWELVAPDPTERKKYIKPFKSVLSELESSTQTAWLDKRPAELYDHSILAPEAAPTKALMVDTLMLFALGLMFYGLVMLMANTIGIEWDMDRSAGRLEPWTMVSQPLWALYLGQTLASGVLASAVLLVNFTVAKMLGLGMNWGTGLAACALAGSLITLFATYGVFVTVLFHHRLGRMFARIALSPLNLSLLFGFRLFFSGAEDKDFLVQLGTKMEHSSAVIMALLAGATVCWILLACLVPLIEWRIGARRQGLRKT